MAAALSQPPLKLWTRAELESLEETGVLGDARYELIEGQVFDKIGQNPPHATAIHRLMMLLASVFGIERVRCQLPVEPAERDSVHSLPLPDIAVVRDALEAYGERHPGPGDVLLVAEVSDSTYQFDSQRKANLYARAAFPECIVLDLNRRELLVFRSPRADSYTLIQVLRPGDTWTPLHAPDKAVAVADLLP